MRLQVEIKPVWDGLSWRYAWEVRAPQPDNALLAWGHASTYIKANTTARKAAETCPETRTFEVTTP